MIDIGGKLSDRLPGDASGAFGPPATAADIRAGLAACEFEPFFQPVVKLIDKKLVGFEALARWRSPARGLVPPGEFVGHAEALGLIRAIDAVILERAWRALDEALEQCPDIDFVPVLSVNLSGEHFVDGRIVEQVRALLAEGRGRRSRLQFEITETLLISRAEFAERILNEIKSLGVSLALDDFGTGYSSLTYLHRFPIDCIKIDRSFTSQVVSSDRARAIVRATIGLAQSIGLSTVAEGIEERQVADELVKMGCQYGQGIRFGTPFPADRLLELMQAPRSLKG